jgi:hypothetical protein
MLVAAVILPIGGWKYNKSHWILQLELDKERIHVLALYMSALDAGLSLVYHKLSLGNLLTIENRWRNK